MNSEAKVGFFVVVAIAILTFFMVNIGDWRIFGEGQKTYQVVSRFNNVVGLSKGAGVALSGVRIGEVMDIRLEGQKALVVMEIDDNVDFSSSSLARIMSVGLLGQAAVEIIPRDLSTRTARETGEIGSLDPVTIDQLVAVISDISSDATELVSSIRDFLYGNEARIVNILENLRGFTDELELMLNENRTALRGTIETISQLSEDMKKQLPAILDDVKSLTADLRTIVAEHRDEVGGSITKAQELMNKLDAAAATLQEILDKVNEGEGSIGQLINQPETIDNVNKVVTKADSLLTDFDKLLKSPGGLTFDYGFRAEYFGRSEDLKYYYRLNTRFNAEDSMMIELINDQIHNKPPIFDPNETEPSQALDFLGDDFTFSATYGRKIPGGTVRVGLIESTTGLAVDLGNKDDNLTFSLEGYDFGRAKGPHFKVAANLKIWGGFHLTVGYDDPADEHKSQIFYGGGFRF